MHGAMGQTNWLVQEVQLVMPLCEDKTIGHMV